MTEENNSNSDRSLPLRGTGGLFPLSEGSFTIDRSKVFVPFDEATDRLEDRPVGSLLVEIQPFLLKTEKDLLLLDTGLGFNASNGQLQLHENIRRAGFAPEQVTKVLLSHLHKDHAGGVANPSPQRFGAADVMNLPNATYYLQKRELDFAWRTGFPSFTPDEIEPLLHSHQVEFLHDDSGTIDGYIRYQLTGAHSPFHQVFWIDTGGETVFFGGDVAPQLQQMKIRYKTKYDFEPDKAMALRGEWWERGNAEGWTFLFYHDIKQPVYKKGNG